MNFNEWLTTKPLPSLETALQLLHEPPERRRINEYLLTDSDVTALREYIAANVHKFSRDADPVVDDYSTQVTLPEDQGLYTKG